MLRPCALILAVALVAGAGCSKPASREAHFIEAPAGPVAEIVRAALADARADDASLVVYVGADWCEPCRHFHEAVDRGALPDELAGLRFLDFDADRDEDRLAAAGYDGRMLPRFVVPGADGRGTDRRFEGSIKGPGAVANIVPRLRGLFAPAPDSP